jgi:hypothetical protein
MTLTQLAAVRDLEAEVIELYERTGIDLSGLEPISTTAKLAPVIKRSVSALNQDRYLRRGIPYLQMGREIRYARRAVARYLLDNYHTHDGK